MAILINKSALSTFSQGIVTALAPVTTSTSIKVYDHIPQSQQTFPYIVVRDMTETEWGSKTKYGSTISFSIETYIQDKNSLSTKNLGSVIIETLKDNFNLTGFNIIYSTLNSFDVTEMENSVYLGTLSFNYFIEEV